MHITRIEVRHWRRHNQLLIDGLSDRINLISGPNEAGKTTIAEALRYALFEPCKPNYDARKAIQQRLASEAPEVEVDLLVAEQQWRIEKRFLKRQMTKLTDPNGRIVEGDDAEQKIQELLGINIPNAGRVSKDVDLRHLGLWPILWLRQGELSGLDGAVTDGVRSKLSELVAHEVGAVSAGPLGSRALDLVQREHDLFWTSSALKPTGEYAKAMKDYEAALSRRDQARNQLQIFEVTVRDLQELTDRLGTLGPRQRAAEEQTDVMRVRARQATERLRELEQHRGQLEGFRRESVEVTKLQTQRKQLEANLVSCQANYAKFSAQEFGLEAERQRLEQTKFRLDSVANTTQQGAKDAHERAEQAREIAERESLSLRIAERTTQLQRIEDLVQAHRQAIAVVESIPEISSRTLKDLQGKAAAYRDACLQRDAASTAIIFQSELSQSVEWTTDGKTISTKLPTGEIFEGKTTGVGELHLAGVGTVRIRVGAGEAANLADTARTTGATLEDALQKLRVSSVEEAQAQSQARLAAVGTMQQTTAALTAALGIESKANAETIATTVEKLHREVTADQARLTAIPAHKELGINPESARSAARAARDLAEAAQADAKAIHTELQGVRDRLASVRTESAVQKERVERIRADLERIPPSEELNRLQKEAEIKIGDAVNRESDLRQAWEALGGAEATNEAEAQATVAKRLQEEVQTSRQRRDILLGQLRATADQDPAATLQEAEAEVQRLSERSAILERQAKAVRLLRETLLTIQRETRTALAAPVRAAIEPYLRRIFPRATLLLGDDDWRLTGLSAGEADEPFDQLSLGAREQFALLVRLGLAEVFAQGRRLPLVLDDPLINADPIRRSAMIQALRHASRKLQILLFTCHEAEHDSLAAEKSVVLTGSRV